MNILVLIIVGAVIGLLARLFMPGRDSIGMIATILIGIVGAVLGGYLWRQAFGNSDGVEWIGGILMAMALLFVYRKIAGGRTTLA